MVNVVKSLHLIAVSKNGADVRVNLIHSDAALHIAQQPHILTLAKEMLAQESLNDEEIDIEHDFGRVIGNSEIVETTAKDTIVYAKLLKREDYSRFVRKRSLLPSNYLSMSVRRIADNTYEIIDIWIGRLAPPFPSEEDHSPDSVLYWSTHAIVLDGQSLQVRTLTKNAPF